MALAAGSRLNRDVAIKTSLAGFSGRFRVEAQAIAALNHPNICTLHDIGPDYLVMEYIEGPTLAERIKQGPVHLIEALAIAGQVAAALEAAHEKSIVHRDLKPERATPSKQARRTRCSSRWWLQATRTTYRRTGSASSPSRRPNKPVPRR